MSTVIKPATMTDIVYEASGRHLLLTLSQCSSRHLNDEEVLADLAHKAATATGATVLDVISRRFQPQGITVLVMLAESHASLHTYPESGVVFWDCFTCGQTCDPQLSVSVLEEGLQPAATEKQMISRGEAALPAHSATTAE